MEEKELFERLKEFIKKETFVNDVEITSNTIIETEFGVTGDDADDFIIAFSKEFNIDISNFEIAKHFKGEGDTTLIGIVNFFKGNKTEEKYSALTVGDLERAILAGKLDETVIGC
jgi:acyl carrier protein